MYPPHPISTSIRPYPDQPAEPACRRTQDAGHGTVLRPSTRPLCGLLWMRRMGGVRRLGGEFALRQDDYVVQKGETRSDDPISMT